MAPKKVDFHFGPQGPRGRPSDTCADSTVNDVVGPLSAFFATCLDVDIRINIEHPHGFNIVPLASNSTGACGSKLKEFGANTSTSSRTSSQIPSCAGRNGICRAGGATGRPTGCNGEGARWSVSGDRSGVGVVCEWAQAVGGVWVARGGGRGKRRKKVRRSAEFDAGRARRWPNCANVIRLTGVVFALLWGGLCDVPS